MSFCLHIIILSSNYVPTSCLYTRKAELEVFNATLLRNAGERKWTITHGFQSSKNSTQKSPEGRHVSFYTRWKLLLPNTLQKLTWWECIQSELCLSYTSASASVKLLWLRQAYWIHWYKSYLKKSMLTNVKRRRWFWGHFCFNFLSSFSFTEGFTWHSFLIYVYPLQINETYNLFFPQRSFLHFISLFILQSIYLSNK